MPLKAILDAQEIHSFTFNENDWEQLKQSYKSQHLTMPCCGYGAIPKTSKLDNYHFSHKPKSDCQYARESPDHLYLKYQVAKLAHEAGWDVTTEYAERTPDGKLWIADIYCVKNKAKMIFEIQLSQQSKDIFKERQSNYIASGINRVMWLYKLRKGKHYYRHDIGCSNDLAIFGLLQDDTGAYYLPQFSVSVTDFIRGVFNKKLMWFPKNTTQLKAEVIPHQEKCYKCEKQTNIVLGLDIFTSDDIPLDFLLFSDDDCKHLIATHISNDILRSHGIAELKPRYSKTVKQFYYSNGCIHCDALQGDHYLHEALVEYWGGCPKAVHSFTFEYNGTPHIEQNWYFDGKRAKRDWTLNKRS